MTSLATRREPFSRGERVLFALLPLGILGFIGSALWIAQSDRAPHITFPVAAPLPVPNGFDFYLAAATAITPANPSVDPVDERRAPLKPQIAAQNYSLARRTAWLSANRAGFALFQQGIKTPSRFDPASGFAALSSLRQLARDKTIEANTLVLQKRWNEATRASLDAIQLGNDIARGGPLIAKLVGSGVVAIGRDPLFTDQFVPEKLDAPGAKSAARRLETILAGRPSYKDALVQGKWQALSEFLDHVQKGNWRALGQQNRSGYGEITWRERLSSQLVSPSTVTQNISDAWDKSIATVQKPFRIPMEPPTLSDPISTDFIPEPDIRFSEGREIVPLNVLLLRLALRAYQLENGRFPATLNQLSPKYLKQIPTDYFASGAPFRFKNRGQNYDLWSVGPDKIDNGGAPLKSYDGKSGANAAGRFPSLGETGPGDYVAGKNR